MMRIAVTGRHGQVATALQAEGRRQDIEIVCLARPDFDLAHTASIDNAIAAARADVIISAAAYTAVDAAEAEPRLAFQINADGPRHVARAAARLGVPIIQLSTDYVFDGHSGAPYRESDEVGPLGHYGRSKLAGEAAVRTATDNHAIVRTAWVHGPVGRNFIRTMLRIAAERDDVAVVEDQIGSPTSARHIALGLLEMATAMRSDDDPALRGTFHMVSAGACSWADLAKEVFQVSGDLGGPVARVTRIPTAEFPTTAPRPMDSRLDTAKLAERYGIRLPDWRRGVTETVQAIAAREGWQARLDRRAS